MKTDPAQLKHKKQLAELRLEIAAMKSETRKLQRKLAKLSAEKFSLKSEVAALKKQLEKTGNFDLGDAIRKINERNREPKT